MCVSAKHVSGRLLIFHAFDSHNVSKYRKFANRDLTLVVITHWFWQIERKKLALEEKTEIEVTAFGTELTETTKKRAHASLDLHFELRSQ